MGSDQDADENAEDVEGELQEVVEEDSQKEQDESDVLDDNEEQHSAHSLRKDRSAETAEGNLLLSYHQPGSNFIQHSLNTVKEEREEVTSLALSP